MTKLLSKRQVRERVLYSPAHIARLELAGTFPKRVRLGQGRVGWVEEEIEEWLKKRIAERDNAT
jgi:prophage regulatory protein